MLRLALLIILVWLLLHAVGDQLRRLMAGQMERPKPRSPEEEAEAPPKAARSMGRLLPCIVCGRHVAKPESDDDEAVYCSDICRARHKAGVS